MLMSTVLLEKKKSEWKADDLDIINELAPPYMKPVISISYQCLIRFMEVMKVGIRLLSYSMLWYKY